MIDELADALGGVDVLVDNASTSREGALLELSYDWRHTLAVDLDGADWRPRPRAGRRAGL